MNREISITCTIYPTAPTVEQFVGWSIHSAYPPFTISFASDAGDHFTICVETIWVPYWNILDVRNVSVAGTHRHVTQAMIQDTLKEKLKDTLLSILVDPIVEEVMRKF